MATKNVDAVLKKETEVAELIAKARSEADKKAEDTAADCEKIKAAIISEANEKADKIKAEAKAYADKLFDEAKKTAAEKQKDIFEKKQLVCENAALILSEILFE